MGNMCKTVEDESQGALSDESVPMNLEQVKLPVIPVSTLRKFYFVEVDNVSIVIKEDASIELRIQLNEESFETVTLPKIRKLDKKLERLGRIKNLTVEVLCKKLACPIFKRKMITENLTVHLNKATDSNLKNVLENIVHPMQTVTVKFQTTNGSGEKVNKTIKLKNPNIIDLNQLTAPPTGC